MTSPPENKVCYNCGQRLEGSSQVVWIVLFLVLGIPGCCLGTCLLSIANAGADPLTLLIGLAGIAAFLFFLVMLIRTSKK